MPVEVIMPKVDMDMDTGTVMTWHVAEGEHVEKGAPLFDIETDKAAMEVEAEAAGVLHHRVAEGTEVAIGGAVAWLYSAAETVGARPEAAAPTPHTAAGAQTPQKASTPKAVPPVSSGTKGTRATPKARAAAQSNGLRLADINGSGPQGRVQAADVEALLAAVAPAPSPAAPALYFAPETGPLAVTRSGMGDQMPTLFLHGFANDAKSWSLLDGFYADRPTIRVDLPGHGKSPKLAFTSFAQLSALLRRCFDDLGQDQVHIVGHSLGAALALSLADTRARKIASLTLIAPAGLGPEINARVLGGIASANRAESLAPWLKELVADPARITDSYARRAMAARADAQMRAAQRAYRDILFPDGTQPFDLRPALARIDVPTRIVWGKADKILPWRHALEAPGHVALHLFDGIGHMPQMEMTDRLGALLATRV
ncbi:MAG: acetoin dehydrogenase dihydrolipoyllysine-residue acetyltransferase subunit [Pseudomonadota bacterium]